MSFLAIALHLIVVDGHRCFISSGPATGELREPNPNLALGDRIAIDVEALQVIQSYPGHSLKKGPWELIMIRQALELRLGVTKRESVRR
jgi:uncharacterized protein (DUF362 family)